MTHFAKVEDGIVTQVIVAEQSHIDTLSDASRWVQTSYNTRAGIHYAPNSNDPDGGIALRKNFAGIGHTYDEGRDAFISPKPYDSWVLDDSTGQWNAPIPHPGGGPYWWNEVSQQWILDPDDGTWDLDIH